MIALRSVAAAAVVLSLATAASASTVNFVSGTSLEGLGSFTGSMEYVYGSGKVGSLTISITNTSNPTNGGFLTGIAFNAPVGIDVKKQSGFGNFDLSGRKDSKTISASPWAKYSWAILSTTTWNGGGNPNGGLAPGATATFVMEVKSPTNAVAAALTTMDFFTKNRPGDPALAVRMRGFSDGGSDKIPGEEWTPVDPDPGPTPVTIPLPGAALAGSVGLFGLIGRRR